jgi:FdhD protein
MEGIKEVEVERIDADATRAWLDVLAVEEPLEIRVQLEQGQLNGPPRVATVAITMRTPGNDAELAVGYLFTEGIVRDRDHVVDVRACRAGAIRVALAEGAAVDLTRLERHSYTTSSCGVCGKISAASLRTTPNWPLPTNRPTVDGDVIRSLPALLRRSQTVFDATGGLHASALFDLDGRLVVLREDVGRHNALDKVIGAELLAGQLPADERILIVSGRVSFELVQKALMAGIPIVAAVGAPSSLAVELAREAGMTLIGFVRADRFNVYAGSERLPRVILSAAKDRLVPRAGARAPSLRMTPNGERSPA